MAESGDSLGKSSRRTLAAIVFTDAVGWSALANQNEELALRMVQRDLDMIRGICQQCEGRVLKFTGDGLLLYFDSAVQAVACALQAQQALAEAAKSLPPEQVFRHRVGIHLGDVFVTESDVMGDGVNIASRLQSEAQPGGICISQTVYDVVKNRLGVQATYLGPRELKNIKEAVPVYQILLEAQGKVAAAPARPAPRRRRRPAALWASLAAGVVLLGTGGGLAYHFLAGGADKPGTATSADAVAAAGTPAPAGLTGQQSPTSMAATPAQAIVAATPAGTDSGAVAVRPSPTPTAAATPRPTPTPAPTPPPPDPRIETARRSYFPQYEFAKVVQYLEQNNLRSTPAYERYSKLRRLRTSLEADLGTTLKETPLEVQYTTPEGTTEKLQVWAALDGGIMIKGPQGTRTVDFVQIEPLTMSRIVAAWVRTPAAANPVFREAGAIFAEECKSLGLIPAANP